MKFSVPEVLSISVDELDGILELPEINPRFISEDLQKRRLMYLIDAKRNEIEKDFVGMKNLTFFAGPINSSCLLQALMTNMVDLK